MGKERRIKALRKKQRELIRKTYEAADAGMILTAFVRLRQAEDVLLTIRALKGRPIIT